VNTKCFGNVKTVL